MISSCSTGMVVEHPHYGTGRVLARFVQTVDNRQEWANEVRFGDGKVRLVVPRLVEPPMRRIK